jgi:glycosyltransferase involved in cell wall biosynthesis
MSALRLLVISPSCHQPVNRAVYRELAVRGVPVYLAVPQRHFVFGAWRETPVHTTEAYTLDHIDLKGTNLRLQRVSGMRALVRKSRPTHVFVDADPASLLVVQAALAVRGAKLSAITAENLPSHFGAALADATLRADARSLANTLVKMILRTLTRPKLDRVFTISEDGSRVVTAMGLTATKVPLGYDPELFHIQPTEKRAETRARLGLSLPTVAYFGRLVPEKGVHILIDAMASLPDRNWRLLLDDFSASGGNYVQDLRQRIQERGIADRIVFFTSSHEDMPNYMNAADLVVLPSLSTPKWKEQYGRVIQEAQACGRVVIGSDSGAIPEVLDGHGHVFPEGDTQALSALLHRLLEAGVQVDTKAAESARRNRSIQRQADILEAYLREK